MVSPSLSLGTSLRFFQAVFLWGGLVVFVINFQARFMLSTGLCLTGSQNLLFPPSPPMLLICHNLLLVFSPLPSFSASLVSFSYLPASASIFLPVFLVYLSCWSVSLSPRPFRSVLLFVPSLHGLTLLVINCFLADFMLLPYPWRFGQRSALRWPGTTARMELRLVGRINTVLHFYA